MNKLFLIICLFIVPFTGFSQRYTELMNGDRVNFYEVQREAEEYFLNKDHGKGSGYKQYKRWEYLSRKKIDDNGFIISDRQVWDEFHSYKANQNASGRMSLGGDWKSLGPNSWNRTSGWNPGVGRIVCIAVEPIAQQLIYVGTPSPSGTLWKSTDGGSSWRVLTDHLPMGGVWSVSIDPNDTSKVYMGTSSQGVQKSTNGGQTWSTLSGTGGTVRRILISSANSNLIYAASSSGIWRTTNAGTNWTKVHFSSVEDMDFKPGDESVVYGVGSNFYKSTNNGLSFSQITSGITHSTRMKLAVTPADPNYVYLVQREGSHFGRLYRSTNGGTSFTIRIAYQGANTGTNFLGYSSTADGTGGQAGRDMAIAVSRTNKDEVHIAGISLWKSVNGGTGFTVSTVWSYPNAVGYVHADVEVLQFVGNNLYTGSDGGIYKSTDNAANFTDLTTGLEIRQFYRIGGSQLDSNLVTGGSQDNGTSAMRGPTRAWVDWLGADGMETFVDISNPNILYGTSQFGSMYKSVNQGNSRTGISKPSGVGNGSWVTPFEPDPQVASTIYVGFDELYKKIGSGGWNAISSVNFGNMDELALAPSDNQTIYMADGGTMYRTTNGGTNWTNISSGITGVVNYISVDPNDPQRVALAVSGSSKVLLSTNGGSNWTSLASGLPGIAANCVLLDHTADNGIYVGMQSGVYYRDDSQPTWISFLSGLPLVNIYELEIQVQSQKIRAASYGRGLWESPIYNAGNSAPIANFTADKTNPVVGDTVFFTDVSAGSATSWLWSFPGGNPSSSTAQSPAVIYSTGGIYDVSLTVTNAFGTDSITKTSYVNVRPYCISTANASIDSYIQTFQFAGINHSDASCATYTDLTNLVAQADRGNTYQVSVTTSDCDGGNSFNKGFNMYIDWNANNIFDEVNELVFSSSIQASGTFVTGITIPLTAVLGTTGLRIVCSETAPILACGTYNWGETEDYKVNIGDTVISCPTVQIDPAFKTFVSCHIDSIITLGGGQPIGGSFSGNNVSSGQFNIQTAGPGNHKFYYNYDDGLGCSGIDSGSITINASPTVTQSNFSNICFSGSPITLSGGSPSGGAYSGPGVTGIQFDPSLAGVGIHSIYYSVTNAMGCVGLDSGTIDVMAPPVVTVSNFPGMCVDAGPLTLSGGSPSGGTYSGTGVTGVQFDPMVAGIGVHTISYSFTDVAGCSGIDSGTVQVSAIPVVTQSNLSPICFNTSPITLSGGSPAGGSYTGPGVSGLQFDPIVAGVGIHTIVYSFSNGANCIGMDSGTIEVISAPIVSQTNLPGLCLNSSPINLSGGSPVGGTYSGPGVSGNQFDPSVAGSGVHNILYTYSNGIGCSGMDSGTIAVSSLPSVTQSNLAGICMNASPIALSGGSPMGGTYSGPGVSGGNFSPSIAGVGLHQFIYHYSDSNNCGDQATGNIEVFSVPVVSHPSLAGLCPEDIPFPLVGGMPAGGSYSGPGVIGNQFSPFAAGPGVHTLLYTVTDANSCSEIASFMAPVFNSPQAGFSYSNNGLTFNFIDSSSNAASWSWDFGDGVVSPGQNPFHTYASTGTYTVCLDVQTFNGCLDQNCQDVVVELLGISGQLSGGEIKVFPNPFSNDLHIGMDFEHEEFRGSLVDIMGRRIIDFKIEADTRDFQIPVPSLSAGTYILLLESGDERIRIPIEKK